MSPSQYNPDIHHRRSIRLKGHDYAGGGLYFVTLCAHNRQQLFGRMEGGRGETSFALTQAGRVVEECWKAIPEHFPEVEAGALAVMPDHVHGLVRVGAVRAKDFSPILSPILSPAQSPAEPPIQSRPQGTSRTLGSVVRGFKVGVTKWVRDNTNVQEVWHRNYYEMIVRNAEAEKKITQYIRMNPWRCVMDFGNGLRGMGNPALWNAEKLGVLCSHKGGKGSNGETSFAHTFAPTDSTVLSGFHSPMEKEIFARLLELKKPVIWCPAWGVETTRLPPAALEALEQNRMLILEMRDTTGDLAAAEQRNRFVLEQADKLWLPHVTPGGMLDRLVREMQVQGKMG
jgi:REP element-mobilizing transposase RayT